MLPSKNYHSATLDSCYIDLFQVTTDKKKSDLGTIFISLRTAYLNQLKEVHRNEQEQNKAFRNIPNKAGAQGICQEQCTYKHTKMFPIPVLIASIFIFYKEIEKF